LDNEFKNYHNTKIVLHVKYIDQFNLNNLIQQKIIYSLNNKLGSYNIVKYNNIENLFKFYNTIQ